MDINAIERPARGENFEGKVLIIRKSALDVAFQEGDRRFKARSGFGCNPEAMGRAVFGTFADGEAARMDRHDFEGIAKDQSDF